MKNRVLSSPPMVILLDVLFVYLFILILSSSTENIQINYPKDRIFKNAKILTLENNQYYECDLEARQLVKFYAQENESFHKFLECEEQEQCIKAKTIFGDREFVILLPSNLFNEISKISMLAFGLKSCNKLKFTITDKGVLDREELFKNKCLDNIYGFKENYKGL